MTNCDDSDLGKSYKPLAPVHTHTNTHGQVFDMALIFVSFLQLVIVIITMAVLDCRIGFSESGRYFVSGALIDLMTYLWGRRNSTARMQVLPELK